MPGIVVVDLDDSDVEDSPDEQSSVRVNSALMDRIRSRLEPDFQANIPPPDRSNALVLFKPVLTIDTRGDKAEDTPSRSPNQSMVEDVVGDVNVDDILTEDDDAMDIEQM